MSDNTTQRCSPVTPIPAAARLALVAIASIGLAAFLPAHAGEALSLERASVHAGGGSVSAGAWRAVIAIGQPEVVADGVARGGTLELTGGVLIRAAPQPAAVFGDGFED